MKTGNKKVTCSVKLACSTGCTKQINHGKIISAHTAISRKVVGKKHQSARDKTERWYGYSLEFCILAKFVFLHVEICFSSQGPISLLYFYCRISLSEENPSKLQKG